jgi:peptidoglycan/LPS O-acetylase OafA/YrhL
VGRIPSLDGIRAISFMAVFICHAGLTKFLTRGLAQGDVGVTLFFFLSGFIITTLLRTEFDRYGSIDIARFWQRRALRIIPPLFIAVLVAAVMTIWLYRPGTMSTGGLMSTLLFYANYWDIRANYWDPVLGMPLRQPRGMEVVWSLSVEEHFYLLFPLLYTGMRKLGLSARHQALLLWGLCALVLAWRCVLVMEMDASKQRIFLGTDTRIDSILFGCALAVWHNPALDEPLAPDRWMYWLLPPALMLFVACIAYENPTFANTWYYTLQGVAMTVLFTGAIRYHRVLPFQWLNSRPIAYVGAMSYSLYLVHSIFLSAAAQLWPRAHAYQRLGFALIATFLSAWAIHQTVEKPLARLRVRLERGDSPSRQGLEKHSAAC